MISDHTEFDSTNGIIATIENRNNPSQIIAIKYLPDEQAFVTSGISTNFYEKEILIPAHLLVVDFELMGTIISVILEEISLAHELETTFEYPPSFEVMDMTYLLTSHGEYMRLSVDEE